MAFNKMHKLAAAFGGLALVACLVSDTLAAERLGLFASLAQEELPPPALLPSGYSPYQRMASPFQKGIVAYQKPVMPRSFQARLCSWQAASCVPHRAASAR